MNNIIKKNKKFSFTKNLKEARKSVEYYKEDLLLDVSSRIIDVMENRNITRSHLAKNLNVSPAYVTKILQGHTNMSIETLAKVAFALDLKWECVLIPKNAKIGIYGLDHESGTSQVCKVETTTVKMEYSDTTSIDPNEYKLEEMDNAMPISA